jgi:hypothetical protein
MAGATLRVATLPDIIRSKKAAGRPRDRAVLDLLEKTYEEAPAGETHQLPAQARRVSRNGSLKLGEPMAASRNILSA